MIHELQYDNTNTYLIFGTKGLLLFDTGWAGTFIKMCKALGEKGIKLQDIDYLLISHFHPDHMGIAGELAKQGMTVVVMESQKEFVHASDYIFERDKRFTYVPINDDNVKHLSFEDSRAFLQELGIDGEIIPTPGHSDDSVSLVLDSGDVFMGDLYPLYELEAHQEPDVQESWKKILATKPKRIFYGHAKTAVLGEVIAQRNAEIHDTVKKMMQLIDKGASIDKIATKLKVEKEVSLKMCSLREMTEIL